MRRNTSLPLIWKSYIEPIGRFGPRLNTTNSSVVPMRTHELSDKVTRKLVEFAREGVIDLETLRERTLAEIMRS